MGLRPTHLGYAYQDLLTAIRLVDVVLGRATSVIVDTKLFDDDRFDDVTCEWRTGTRERLQIKHTDRDRELEAKSFTNDRRGLRLDLLVTAVDQDVRRHPDTSYRVVLRDTEPHDPTLAAVLKPMDASIDPGPAVPGLGSTRFRFDASALRAENPWQSMVADIDDDVLGRVCEVLVVDVGLPGCSLDIRDPGPAERVLLRRLADELGAGRPPNRHRTPEDVALALIEAAKAARGLDGRVTAPSLIPRLDLAVDFGAVREGHPVDPAVAVARLQVLTTLASAVEEAAEQGATVVVTGGPGSGKSWLCEQLADRLREEWIVARHHCWLGAADTHRDRRVLSDVVIGSLLRQLEAMAPASLAEIRPRYAATRETLAAAVCGIRRDIPDRPIALIVDGLDHISRVRGRNVGAAFHGSVDPAHLLIEELSHLELPPGAVLLLASQPGDHLAAADSHGVVAVTVPPLSRPETYDLARRFGVLAAVDSPAANSRVDDRARAAVDLIQSRSRGNALYATYLCRQALGPDPSLHEAAERRDTALDPLDRLRDVPESAHDLDEYYAYLLAGLTPEQRQAVSLLAVCDFAVTADELQEIFPLIAPTLTAALAAVAPIVAQQPGIGGLKIHHESFSRFARREAGSERWLTLVRTAAAEWLAKRGFFTDTRAFRHLPELLADLDRHDDLVALVGPDFLCRAIAGLQPPAAIAHTLAFIARRSAASGDWPVLVRCVELRRAFDTYENENLSGSLVAHADVLIALLGADVVAASLLYDGGPTVSARWGLQLCAAVDQAGAAAPWEAYLAAWEDSRSSDNVHYGADSDNDVFLAELRGQLRLPRRRDRGREQGAADEDISATAERVAVFLDQDDLPELPRVLDVLLDCLGPSSVLASVPLIERPATRAAVLLRLADVAASAGQGLPSPRTLAVAAWASFDAEDPRRFLRHGISITEIADDILGADIGGCLRAATEEALRYSTPGWSGAVRRWLTLLAVAQQCDPHAPHRLLPLLDGPGFFRAWLRFAVAVVGLGREVDEATLTPQDASAAVRVALDHLAQSAQPFTGKPRACDLWGIHADVHGVVHDAVALLIDADLEPALASLTRISDGTTTSLAGMGGSGPLVTTDLLAILSRAVDHTRATVVHQLMGQLRDEHESRRTLYPESADFELAMARVSLIAGDAAEARECWERAAHYMAAYGSHKDITIHELLGPLPNLVALDPTEARTRLAEAQPLTYLVAHHTDGRSTSSTPHDWWRLLADIDPYAAATLAAEVLLTEPGLPDALAEAAHHRLLDSQATTADPVILAALRVTAGSGERDLDRDTALLGRLAELPSDDQARVAGLLSILANAITATYDDQFLTYASEEAGSDSAGALRQAAHLLAGDGAPPLAARPGNDGRPRRDRRTLDTADLLDSLQRPMLPPGAAGAIAAVRDYGDKSHKADEAAPRWSIDALIDAVGWRLMEVAAESGADSAAQLLQRVADEPDLFSSGELLTGLADGLELRCGGEPGVPERLAAIALTLAFAKIRGGGGYLNFAGRDRLDLWQRAHALDAVAAADCLADQVAETVAGTRYGTIGVTQAVVAAFAAQPPRTSPPSADSVLVPNDHAFVCWDEAFSVIAHRLPGKIDLGAGVYQPPQKPTEQHDIDAALSRLSLATFATPERPDRRRGLLAASVLLTARPTAAQAAIARVLAADIGAGPLGWLLTVLHDGLPESELDTDLVGQVTALARSTMLSVRAEAARVLAAAGCPVPDPPATPAHPFLIHALAADGDEKRP
ncbi:ATP-binding protein [Kitasatospora phosalacinea]|uniref:ATP-binding protein n=1 Tax=Kitasatospora phosalacinea TaxID=2065 RepID=UPI00131D8E34|nr:ATP-binding protein [Kitasatospora phosalacinea]